MSSSFLLPAILVCVLVLLVVLLLPTTLKQKKKQQQIFPLFKILIPLFTIKQQPHLLHQQIAASILFQFAVQQFSRTNLSLIFLLHLLLILFSLPKPHVLSLLNICFHRFLFGTSLYSMAKLNVFVCNHFVNIVRVQHDSTLAS